MGRAERRQQERAARIADRKGKIALRPDELRRMMHKTADGVADYDVEVRLTCFGLVLRDEFGWGPKRIWRAMQGVDEAFGRVLSGETSIEAMKQRLQDETGIRVVKGGEEKRWI